MKKIAISGSPYAGKTTLLLELEKRYPQYEYVSEPASVVLSRYDVAKNEYWDSVFSNPLKFCKLCVEQSLDSESKINKLAKIAFLDRCLVDTIAYARRDNCEEIIPSVKKLAIKAGYDTVLFCDQVGEIEDRIEDTIEARRTKELLAEAYEEMGINLINIPAMSTTERIDFLAPILKL